MINAFKQYELHISVHGIVYILSPLLQLCFFLNKWENINK